jgi:DNA polymerase-3 subunit gamma/tau
VPGPQLDWPPLAETSLYRRHRPQAFDEVVGQTHVVRTLRNAVERDRVHHAYLFVGSRGTGKTSVAKILARSLNCVNGPTVTPCGECESCRTISAGSSMDVIEMDAASNRSVDDIRDLRERVGYAPAGGQWKVYILDEAHMLTREAWNAFLKTLEAPPPNTVFVLATTEPHKVMPTIVDRCQRFDFQRPSTDQIAEVVRRVAKAEKLTVEDGAVAAISRAAGGSFRDALATLDQLVSYGGSEVATDDVLAVLGVADAGLILGAADAIAAGDGKAVLEITEELMRSGRDVSQFARDLLAHLRQLVVISTLGEVPDAFSVTAGGQERLAAQAEAFSDLAVVRAIDAIADALAAIKEGDEPRMTLELALLRAAKPQLDPSRQALMQRLERLEASVGAPPASGPGEPVVAEPEGEITVTRGEDGGGEEPQASANGIDLEQVLGLWPAVVDQVRDSGSELLSTVLAAARPVAVDVEQAVLQVGFPPSAAFNKRKAEAAEARDRFAEALNAIVGQRLRPVYVLLDTDDPEPEAPGLSDEELLAHVKSEFDAEEVDESERPEAKEATE